MKSILKKSKYNIPIQEDDSKLRLTYIVYKFLYFFLGQVVKKYINMILHQKKV